MTFFLFKSNSLFSEVSPNICKNFFLIFSIFFPYETSFPKSIYKVPGKKDVDAYSEPS